jgi:hypothetical protein
MVTLAALACCKAAKAAQLALNLPNLVSFSQPCNIRPKSGWRLQSVQARIPSCRQTGHYLGCSPKQHKCSVLGAASNFHTVRVVYREHLGVIGVTCNVATTRKGSEKKKTPQSKYRGFLLVRQTDLFPETTQALSDHLTSVSQTRHPPYRYTGMKDSFQYRTLVTLSSCGLDG